MRASRLRTATNQCRSRAASPRVPGRRGHGRWSEERNGAHTLQRDKVFGVGFHKTATTSLAAALEQLGYRVTGPNRVTNRHPERSAFRTMERLVPRYDAFQDNPWPLLYRELDQRYPGSKFILTVRPVERWIRSVVDHFGGTSTPMREWIYDGVGDPAGHESHYIERYERHNRAVLEYFAERPSDLLVMDITAGDGWEPLCGFLGMPVPDAPFPRVNSKADPMRRRSLLERAALAARRTIPGSHGYRSD